MPFKEATFWYGTILFTTGIYFWIQGGTSMTVAITLTIIGLAMSAYAVVAEHYALPKLRLWVALLLLTWVALGYDIYSHRTNLTLRIAPIIVFVSGILALVLVSVFVQRTNPKDSSSVVNQTQDLKLVIHRAVYAAGLPTEVSVTDKLQSLVRDGIAVTLDSTLGGLLPHDSAFGVCKRLDVDYSYGSDTRFPVSRWERPAGEITRLVLPEDTEVKRLTSEVQRLTPPAPKIVKLSDRVELSDNTAYPLKLRMHLRNDSIVTADIQLQEYRPELITLMGFPTEVLQLRLRDSWYPKDHGAGRIALYSGQQFEAWVAIDAGKFNKAQVEQHRGRIGTLVLLVNGQNVEIKL
jgi:hypothetical protein